MSYAVVIPSRSISNLRPCVAAVRKNEPDARIVVIDDGLETWDGLPGDIHILAGEKPFVFARNCNMGITYAGPRDVILLNDDALLETPGGFDKLEEATLMYSEIGLVASSCNNVGNPNQLPKGLGLRTDDRMVCFVCVYIPRRTIEKVGVLDERFTGYGMDDDDYCLRVRRAGLVIGIHDGCYVNHAKLHSSYRGSGSGDFRGNLELFKQKWGMDNWGRPA